MGVGIVSAGITTLANKISFKSQGQFETYYKCSLETLGICGEKFLVAKGLLRCVAEHYVSTVDGVQQVGLL
jgi:hypothetical protein